MELYETLEQRTKAERRKNPDQSIKPPQPPWDSIYRGHQRAMVDEFGELDVLTFERDPWCFRDDGDIILDDYLGIRAFILKGNKTEYEKEMMQRYEEALSKIECYPNELTSALQSIHFFINLEDDEGREDDSDTQAGSDLDLDIDGDVNVAREPQSSDDFVVDTIGSGKVLSPIASQGRARRRVPPTVASESDDDDSGGVLLVDNASDDDDFVAKDSARALQSLFRSSDGYDEELARVQRGETEDGGDLYD